MDGLNSIETFTNEFGAWGECENDTALWKLHQRIMHTLNLKTLFSTTSINIFLSNLSKENTKENKAIIWKQIETEIDKCPSVLAFKGPNEPKMEIVSDTKIDNRLSFWKELRKFKFYKNHFDAIENVAAIFKGYNQLIQEFSEKPLNHSHPLQDLHDRCRRMETIAKEKQAFKLALISHQCVFKKTYTTSERIIFAMTYWALSFFNSSYKPAVIPKLQVDIDSFVDKKSVKLSEMEAGGHQVEVRAKLNSINKKTPSSAVTIQLVDKNNGNDFMQGCFTIQRVWDEQDRKKRISNWDEDCDKKIGELSNCRLRVKNVSNFLISTDESKNQMVIRLLTQIAVEIFQCEDEERLEIKSVCEHGFVYASAGFYSSFDKDNKILDEIKKARKGSAPQLYPDHINLSNYCVYLDKAELCSPQHKTKTQFSKRVKIVESEQQHPALVDFKLDEKPITWEEQISQNRILNDSQYSPGEPILPAPIVYSNLVSKNGNGSYIDMY